MPPVGYRFGVYTHQVVLALRSRARTIGALRWANSTWRRVIRPDSERIFNRCMMSNIGPDDVVWDVGANVGVYTERFAGLARRVVAFEPSPNTERTLRSRMAILRNVEIEAVALSDHNGNVPFFTSIYDQSDALGPLEADSIAGVVMARRGDSYPCPTKIKIDVEGYELEVIRGLAMHLENPALRALFVEIHFGTLAERGMPDAPRTIEKLLRAGGFRIGWPDPSHIFARR